MNPNLAKLQSYPFEKLAELRRGVEPNLELSPISLSIGEPKHPPPAILGETLLANLHQVACYPSTRGLPLLREAIADWLERRFQLPAATLDRERQILPVNGTREGLFAIAQAVVDPSADALVMMPNPFYQIYEGAALLAGATPWYLPCCAEHGCIPNFDAIDAATWRRCQLIYLCSPGNPTGAVMDQTSLTRLIELAQQYDFVIAADECYSEIYLDESQTPVSLLQAAAAMGHNDFRRCLVFHSLSKRSNAPGLRSGFVAGDAEIVQRFLSYRTYHGCAMSLQNQYASAAVWGDEQHVIENRRQYVEKFDAMLDILDGVLEVKRPAGGFFLWPRTPISDIEFTRGLYAEQNVSVLPGSFLSRSVQGRDPGAGRIRIALVASLDVCKEAAYRIKDYCAAL